MMFVLLCFVETQLRFETTCVLKVPFTSRIWFQLLVLCEIKLAPLGVSVPSGGS